MTPEQEQQLNELVTTINSLKEASQVDPDIARTLGLILTGTSGKAAGAENQAVDEAGLSTYNVLGAPDGFILLGDKNVPFYN